jgi:hypothetical protein
MEKVPAAERLRFWEQHVANEASFTPLWRSDKMLTLARHYGR